MKHIIALASKIAFTLALLYVILDRVYHASFLSVMFIALFLGFVSYLSGDMLVLPRTNNITASLADFGLSFVILWVFVLTQTRNDFSPFGAALLSAACLTVFEYFFHRYLLKNVLDENFEMNCQPEITRCSIKRKPRTSCFPKRMRSIRNRRLSNCLLFFSSYF